MRHTLAIVLVLAAVVSIGGCDAMVVRQSFVKIAPDLFPSCAASALIQIGYKPTLLTDSSGKKRLYVEYPHGDLNVTVTESASGQGQTVQLKAIVMVRDETASQIEARLGEDLDSITAAIAKSCGNG
jgi:hypothetical protein